ncbi:MAG: efflux RND transporter periplasmic adaptor subunit [Polyangiaceae bacterium]|nr:efflux RND transporter periplasmic adaptor subunit [Polyangiaceae bacterium]MCB9608668.1 efflux RND transporter periplasmic adaptor subunit [Polyangiaceae bacterium]
MTVSETTEPQAAGGTVDDTVRELERELRAQGLRRWLRRGLLVFGVIALFVGFRIYKSLGAPPPQPRFELKALEKRDVVEQVQSTGNVKPLTEVQVGAQVSGRVVKVLVDFNSKVEKGDLLAEIDPQLYGAQVSQSGAQLKASKAALQRSKASLTTAEANLKRAQKLFDSGLSSQAELDQIKGTRDVAKADVAAAQAQIGQIRAQLSSAQTTLAYAKIYSPIDGVVINRSVDPGQTVAASFSAPVLFVIAQDLRKMQVLAEIDEADVGRLEEKMKAEVVVDAFPGEKFSGKVSQVRYSPNNVQGVVTYSAVIDVDNPDLKLRPGMTATVTIRTREAMGAIAIPNAALRFRPLEAGEPGQPPKPVVPKTPLEPNQGRLYLVGESVPVGQETFKEQIVDIGITDGVWTVLKSDQLQPGAEVIIEQRDAKQEKGFKLF